LDRGLDRGLVTALARLDVFDLATPEWLVELAVVAEEIGAALPAVPFVPMAVGALLLGELPAGVSTVGWQTFPEPFGSRPLAVVDGRVSGTVEAVPFGAVADRMVACTSDGIAVVDLSSAVRSAGTAFDLSEPPATVVVDAMPPVAVARPAMSSVLVVLAAELIGTGQRALDSAVGYARQREQFGRPIGSFQAVKHMLADRHVQLDAARGLVRYAAWAVASGDDAELPARTALAAAGDAALAAAADNLQAHGGIGFTWEHPAHRYLRRARARRALVGSQARQYDRIAEHILGSA
jgi:alkylation response protein AidB-like acyl-CoA dehydrogenase